MTKVESATTWMEKIAADNSHGYSQSVRWGPSYDCSSMVISAWEQAGVPVKSRGATYTGNMYAVFIACGFKDVTAQCALATGSGIIRGDVLLNHASHTAMSVGGGRVVHARSSEGTGDTADNSGNEIRIQSYWNYPWDCILRYPETANNDDVGDTATEAPEGSASLNEVNSAALRNGSVGNPVTALQALLNEAGDYYLDMDSEFGNLTQKAVIDFQRKIGLEADGIVGPKTKEALFKYF